MIALTYPLLLALCNAYVVSNKLCSGTFTPTYDNTAQLVDKIAKVAQFDTSYTDKLAFMDAEDLPLGKILEEYNADLIQPVDYDKTGAGALDPHDPSFRPNSYSYPLGEKEFATTVRKYDFQKAVNSSAEYAELLAKLSKKLWDSYAVWKYGVKREILGKIANECGTAMATSTAFAANSSYAVNALVKEAVSPNRVGIVFSKITTAENPSGTTFQNLVDKGYIVPLDLTTTIDPITDEASGEGFILEVKKQIEIASDISAGHSLNGNSLGVSEAGYVLVVRQGINPTIDVKTLAGAFHTDKLAMPAEIITVPNFGKGDTTTQAMLFDRRLARVHRDWESTDTDINGKGGFVNYYLHCDHTAAYSRNLFVHVFKTA